eukprot:250428-Amphidinium_carterae.1
MAPSKTQTFDDTIVLDIPAQLGPALRSLVGRRPTHQLAAALPGIPFHSGLGVGPRDSCYGAQHGDVPASPWWCFSRRSSESSQLERKTGQRPVDVAFNLIRRYAKAGKKVSKLLEELTPAHLKFSEWAVRKLPDLLSGRCVARALPMNGKQGA